MILPLRTLALWLLALLTVCAAGLGIARGAARQAAPAGFPLPALDGCWQGLCLAQLPAEDALAALSTHPAVVPGSAVRITETLSISPATTLRFRLRPEGTRLLVRLEPGSYTLQGDPPVRPLLSLGALVLQIGPPERISLLDSRRVVLLFPRRPLRAEVRPAAIGDADRVALLPGDAVIALQVFDPQSPPPESALYYPLFLPWTGYGIYGSVP